MNGFDARVSTIFGGARAKVEVPAIATILRDPLRRVCDGLSG